MGGRSWKNGLGVLNSGGKVVRGMRVEKSLKSNRTSLKPKCSIVTGRMRGARSHQTGIADRIGELGNERKGTIKQRSAITCLSLRKSLFRSAVNELREREITSGRKGGGGGGGGGGG